MSANNNSLTVEVARESDAEAIFELRNRAAIWLCDKGIEQWKVDQLRRSVIGRRIQNGETFVVRSAGSTELIATLSLDFADEHTWGVRGDDARAGYLHTIVVAADRIGDGIGRRFVGWAENEIVRAGRELSRLDCSEENTALRGLYDQLGYAEVGRKDYGDAWFPVTLFEKRLEP